MASKSATLKGLKPGNYIMVEGEPCRVINIALSKPGKHGSMKARVDVAGIFDDRKRNIMKPADSEVQVPIIEKRKAQVITVSGDLANLMDLEDYSTFDAVIPPDLKGRVEPGKEVGYWKIESRLMIKDVF